MHPTLAVLLLTVSTVFGDFEQILERQYQPAKEAQYRMDWIYYDGVMRQHYLHISNQLSGDFVFYDVDGNKHDKDYFIYEFLFKLDTSIPRKTFDIQNMDQPTVLRNNEDFDDGYIKAAVQWGGVYMTVEWSGSRDYFPLKKVRVTRNEPHILNKVYRHYAEMTVLGMIQNDFALKFAPEFAYRKCNGEQIFDGRQVVAEKILGLPMVLDVIHYYKDNRGANAQHLVQFEAATYNGRTHLFEIDFETSTVLKGMEHSCEVQQDWEQ